MAGEYAGPQIVWDPAKALMNARKHSVTFEEAATVFSDPLLLVIPDLTHSQYEERWAALGKSSSQLLLVVIHTENTNTIRIISARKPNPTKGETMKSNEPAELEDEMQAEYDFSNAIRGKYAGRFPTDVVMVPLAPDVAAAFPDAASVNEALRILIKAAKTAKPAA
jgi:uncharacterized DUF497 family protein